MSFKVLLAPAETPGIYTKYFEELQFPLFVSPKYDGIRAVTKGKQAFSRKGLLLPSLQVQEDFTLFEHADMELLAGNPTDYDVYNRTQSHVMSYDKPGDLSALVFDYTRPDLLNKPFYERLEELKKDFGSGFDNYKLVEHEEVEDLEGLLKYEEKCLALGYEGVMGRNPVGIYKQGRATWKQNIIIKLKRVIDDEAIVTGFVEKMRNENELLSDPLGFAKRSKSREGLVPAGTVGMFQCDYNGQQIDVGTGNFTHDQLQEIWNNQERYRYKILTFRYFGHGIKNLPRHPRAKGWRDKIDL